MIPTFFPSLKHMAAVSVALLLYKTEDIQRFVARLEYHPLAMADRSKNKDWSLIKIATAEKMGDLLPSKLKTLVVEMLRPLLWEWLDWKNDHYFIYIFPNATVKSDIVSWRSDGIIDRTKTAKIFIRSQSYSAMNRFLMACQYFQENEVVTLWDEVRHNLPSGNINIVQRFWVKWLTEEKEVPWTDMVDEQLGNPHQRSSCPWRVSCFFGALLSENRQRYSTLFGLSIVHSDDLRHCFYQMNESERILFYGKCCKNILTSLLRWPFQTIFIPAPRNLQTYLKPNEFNSILRLIINQYILQDFQYFNFPELFKEFWRDSPESHKEHVTRNINFFKVVELF